MSTHGNPNAPNDLDDYQWLVSDDAAAWLDRACQTDQTLLAIAQELRKDLSPARAHLVLEQVELRHRAARSGKFVDTDRMFFTTRLYEQSSSHQLANYKAQKFAPGASVADLCCGLGGDLIALAARGPVVGVDRDPLAALLARANCRGAAQDSARVVSADATEFPLGEFDAWHIDPDRRPAGRRTTRPEFHEPNIDQIERLQRQSRAAAIKLAPAACVPDRWAAEAELEWIGESGECKQLVAWFGKLANRPGQRTATILKDRRSPVVTVTGSPNRDVSRAEQIGRFVFEPHATVLAARLAGDLAARHGLQTVSADEGYLTGDRLITDSALSAFEVTDTLPLDMKRLKSALRKRKLGRLEIKKRGLEIAPAKIRRQLRVPGEEHGVLLLTRFRDRAVAILATRS
jgi:hypothetical protein